MSKALATWRKRLDHLEQQEAIASDAAQKFTLAEQIQDVKAKIVELEAASADHQPNPPWTFKADISRILKYERGPMKLHMADIHLHRARLFGMRNEQFGVRNEEAGYPWESPQKDLAEARRLIEKCGYLRRMGELDDAEAALKMS